MVIQNRNIVFTDEDEKNLVPHKYSDKELMEIGQRFNQKRSRRRKVMVSIILLLLLLINVGGVVRYACYIALIFMIFLVVLFEDIDRTNIKAGLHPYYAEIEIDKVLPREDYVDGTFTAGSDITTYFPIEGHDTTSGYKSIFYINKDQYLSAELGMKVKISVRGE